MAVKDRATAVIPYLQQLASDGDAQASARQAAQATRAAYRRARGKDVEEIIQDKKLRRQVNKAATAISGLWKQAAETPKQKPRWRRPAIAFGLAVAAGLLVTIGPGKAWLDKLIGGDEPDPETAPADLSTVNPDPGAPSSSEGSS